MQVDFNPRFVRQYHKLSYKMQKQFDDRLVLFLENPTASLLRIHPLKGRMDGYWSMNVSGDVRAIYTYKGETIVVFMLIGTHSQLYG
jgi:addiction module RelE/StbE family toxin